MTIRQQLEAFIKAHRLEATRLSDPSLHYDAKSEMIAGHLMAEKTYAAVLKAHLTLL